jgi:hypothetical protein
VFGRFDLAALAQPHLKFLFVFCTDFHWLARGKVELVRGSRLLRLAKAVGIGESSIIDCTLQTYPCMF